jgi:hypothetical protein
MVDHPATRLRRTWGTSESPDTPGRFTGRPEMETDRPIHWPCHLKTRSTHPRLPRDRGAYSHRRLSPKPRLTMVELGLRRVRGRSAGMRRGMRHCRHGWASPESVPRDLPHRPVHSQSEHHLRGGAVSGQRCQFLCVTARPQSPLGGQGRVMGTGELGTRVATETCGHARPLKFRNTVWVY